ncbi:MAG: type IV-A pilus assembly ATPase PilB [candidate division Zixibacteria bacterium]|nr:type IV-A pilus assembly ATPase PilB [candidate division Zixibacteria bacterium]
MGVEIGKMLVRAGKISEEQLKKALEVQKNSKGKLGDILIKLGAVEGEDVISEFVGKQLNIGALRITDVELNPDIVKLIPQDIARKFNVIAVSKIGKALIVAISDPNNIYVLDAIKFITGCNIQPVISPESTITKSIDQYYEDSSGLDSIIKEIDDELEVVDTSEEEIEESDLQAQVQDKPLVKLVDSIIADAIRQDASDIHFECYERRIRVRYRIDGTLQERAPIPFKYRPAIISRMKIMADLDISERRLPQDGRIKIKIQERTVDLRVSVLPTIFGEKVVMRILDPKSLMVDMTKLGFPKLALNNFSKAIQSPYGMILVTGPTGSGKTTTLYSGLKTLNKTDVNIMTAEDPVEFNFDGINQVLVRSDIGLSFAAALRSFLRQDPDIIMVGEIRDKETADIAIKAALTGHLVFSTLHTNDAPSTINRLIDMGTPPFLVAASTRLIMAQRMVKRICSSCKKEQEVTPQILETLGLDQAKANGLKVYKGVGCTVCNNTGYKGRTGIFEVMPVSPVIEKMIINNVATAEIRAKAIEEGMLTLRSAAMDKLIEGDIPLDQVIAQSIADD